MRALKNENKNAQKGTVDWHPANNAISLSKFLP
jgi:hypothetical protein